MAALVITPQIEAAAQKLADATGVTPTQAVENVLRVEAAKVPGPAPINVERARDILRQIHRSPVDMTLTDDEILGYDKDGIPEQLYLGG